MIFTAACVQLRSSTDVAENIETVERLVREAARAGAEYVQTPEMTNIVERNRAAAGRRHPPGAQRSGRARASRNWPPSSASCSISARSR